MFKKLRHFGNEYRAFAIAIIVGIVSLGLDIAGSKYPSLRHDAHFLLGVEASIMALHLLKGMIDDLRSGIYGVDLLAVTAIATSVILHEYWTAMITVLMLTGGEALEDYAESRAKMELTSLLERAPKIAHVMRGRKTVDVAINLVRISDKLIIKPGEVVPVDCTIIEGTSSFDESSLTGESLPVDKEVGGELLSGSINLEGLVTVRATRTAEDSQFEQIIKLVKSAASNQSPFIRLADKYSIPFTIVSFAIAGAVWYISGDVGRFLRVLVVATPCPLLLGAPIGLISGMSRAAKHGIIVKNGAALEKLAQLKAIAFDKTGTLTQGTPKIDKITSYDSKFNEKDILGIATAIEQNSAHILARAITTEAEARSIRFPKVRTLQEVAGRGLSGTVGTFDVLIGKLAFLEEQEVIFTKKFNKSSIAQTAAMVAIDGSLAGSITFTDSVRPETKDTLSRLRASGIKHLMMLTGDHKVTATKIADEVGITDVLADCLPADKVAAIRDAATELKPIGMVGDGVNDAPVLTAADVGIALGARGSTAASESADVVILLDDLTKVAEAREIAKRTFFITKQSILLGIGMSVGLMFIFATGKFKPVYGAGIQELVDVTVIFNALRAHGSFTKPTLPKRKKTTPAVA
jgi:heavy metal translocating P-type ATPase